MQVMRLTFLTEIQNDSLMEIEMKHFILLVLCCSLCCLFGCGGEKLPLDFPKVFPMTITVKDGATPLSKVRIMFYPAVTGAGAAYASSGTTDENGVAKIVTAQGGFSKAGIPAGEFVVTVEDIIEVDLGVTPEEQAKMSMGELNKLTDERKKLIAAYKRKVPEILCKSGKVESRSPIRFTASEDNKELTIDVAEYKK